jgi:hypothetical protein
MHLVYNVAIFQDWDTARSAISPITDFGCGGLLLVLRVTEQPEGLSLDQHSITSAWERVTRGISITTEEFSNAFQRWYEQCLAMLSKSKQQICYKGRFRFEALPTPFDM